MGSYDVIDGKPGTLWMRTEGVRVDLLAFGGVLGDVGLMMVVLGRGGGVFMALERGEGGSLELELGRVDGDGGAFADGFAGRLPHQVARRSSMSFSASFWEGILGIFVSPSFESSNMRESAEMRMGL